MQPDQETPAAEVWERRGLTIFRRGETGLAIAAVTQHQKRAKEHAALIAAAPCMLAALREAEDRIAALEEDGMTKAERAALSRIRAAIAKATTL